jgi:hypothetical protein
LFDYFICNFSCFLLGNSRQNFTTLLIAIVLSELLNENWIAFQSIHLSSK